MKEEFVMNIKIKNMLAVMTLIGGLIGIASQAMAHHAFSAEYDGEKPFELKGTVTKAKWVNPHSWLYADVKGPDGKVANWGFEFAAPNALAQRGISKTDLVPGTEVTIKGFYSKSGESYGYASGVTLADGRSFSTGGAPDATAAPATRTQ